MKSTPIKTHTIHVRKETIFELVNHYIPTLSEGSIVVVTSKIISLCEGAVVSHDSVERDDLIKKEADLFLPRQTKYDILITVKKNTLALSAGVDRSNADGYYIVWPKDPQKSANDLREYLTQKHQVKNVGVIITDSHSIPLRRGIVGMCIAHSGFAALNDYRGKKDLFDRTMHVSIANIAEGLAASAVVCMGEGEESTPFALITDIPMVTFQPRNPTPEELEELSIAITEDLYSPILTKVPWKKSK